MELHDPKRLAAAMRRKGMSNRALARAVGWKSHSYVNRLVSGAAKNVETDPALRMAYVLDLGVDDLFITRAAEHPKAHDSHLRAVS